MCNGIYVPKHKYFEGRDLLSAFDMLTGVLNRETIHEYAVDLISHNVPFSLVMIDIDNFKYINDNYGHLTGDKALKEVSKKICDIVKDKGVIGRFGGDEFVVLFENIVEYEKVWNIMHTLNDSMSGTYFCDDAHISITFTSGLSRFPLDGKDIDSVIETTDKALYRGKMKGRNCFIIYLPEKHKNIDLKSEKDKMFSSMFLHSKVFDLLNGNKPMAECIEDYLKYFTSYLMLDRVCIETTNGMKYKTIHELSDDIGYKHIDIDMVMKCFNNNGLFYVNTIDTLKDVGQDKLYDIVESQKVKAFLMCDIRYQDKSYGFIRVETTNKGRIWQSNEIDLVLTGARIIAMQLFYKNETL